MGTPRTHLPWDDPGPLQALLARGQETQPPSSPPLQTPQDRPRPRSLPAHVVERSAVALLLQLVQCGVEEAQGRQPPLQPPVVDQSHHAGHHRRGRLRTHGLSAGARGTRYRALAPGVLLTDVPDTQGSGMRFVTTQ